MFPDFPNLDKIAHLCKINTNKPVTKEDIDKILGRVSN